MKRRQADQIKAVANATASTLQESVITDENRKEEEQPPNKTQVSFAQDQKKKKQEDSIIERHKLPNLCDPAKGLLFPGFDKTEDWDDFDNKYKDEILQRFKVDTKNHAEFTQALNRFISRMYRLDGTIGSIIAGKENSHVQELDFSEEAPP